MKRYISGLLATAIAVGAVAFTTPTVASKNLTDITFYYVPPAANDYSQASVQDVANWETAPTVIPSCGSTANKACSIVVSDVNTTGSGASRELNFTMHAVAGVGGSSSGFVPNRTTTPQVTSKVDKP